MIVSAPLDLEQFTQPEQGVPKIELEVFSYFYEWGYPVEEVLEAYVALNHKPEQEDSGHLVLKIETLSKPIDEADYVEDKMHTWVCDCRGYQYHYSVDLSERRLGEWKFCPHIESVAKSVKAIQDENQETL